MIALYTDLLTLLIKFILTVCCDTSALLSDSALSLSVSLGCSLPGCVEREIHMVVDDPYQLHYHTICTRRVCMCVHMWLTVRVLGWAGHIQALVGGVVRGG